MRFGSPTVLETIIVILRPWRCVPWPKLLSNHQQCAVPPPPSFTHRHGALASCSHSRTFISPLRPLLLQGHLILVGCCVTKRTTCKHATNATFLPLATFLATSKLPLGQYHIHFLLHLCQQGLRVRRGLCMNPLRLQPRLVFHALDRQMQEQVQSKRCNLMYKSMNIVWFIAWGRIQIVAHYPLFDRHVHGCRYAILCEASLDVVF